MTIKEASNLSGRAEITIRRLVKYLIRQKDILTTQGTTQMTTQKYNLSSQMISQMIRQDRQNESPRSPFTYKISEDLIRKVFDLTTQTTTQDKPDDYSNDYSNDKETTQRGSQVSSQSEAYAEIVVLLREQLVAKDEQLKAKDGQINSLIERNRETNILIGRLQQRVFQLEAPKEIEVVGEVKDEVKNATETKPEGRESDLGGDREKATKKKEKKWWVF